MARLPGSVLFVCNLNRVRSPMAAGLTRKLYGQAICVDSCGLEPSEDIDPMVAVVMQEMGVDLFDHETQDFAELSKRPFELMVALSPEAWPPVQAVAGAESEYWPIDDPTLCDGSREMRLDAYRLARRALEARIVDRFGPPAEWG